MMFLESKLAIFFLILGMLIICSITPSFEGYTSYSTDSVYDPTTYDNDGEEYDNEDMTPPPPPPPDDMYDQPPYDDPDLYILKSQVVPPVCPACPTACPKTKKNSEECPACPPCARCPEPSYDCKLVPNYESANNLPKPVLNDFSAF